MSKQMNERAGNERSVFYFTFCCYKTQQKQLKNLLWLIVLGVDDCGRETIAAGT